MPRAVVEPAADVKIHPCAKVLADFSGIKLILQFLQAADSELLVNSGNLLRIERGPRGQFHLLGRDPRQRPIQGSELAALDDFQDGRTDPFADSRQIREVAAL